MIGGYKMITSSDQIGSHQISRLDCPHWPTGSRLGWLGLAATLCLSRSACHGGISIGETAGGGRHCERARVHAITGRHFLETSDSLTLTMGSLLR
jgi:hypothetical protein